MHLGKKFIEQSEKASGYSFATGYGSAYRVEYTFVQNSSMDKATLTEEIERQLYMKMLLDELKKDKPDVESIRLSVDQQRSIVDQAELIPELNSLFDENEKIDLDSLTVEDMKNLATINSTEFLKKITSWLWL